MLPEATPMFRRPLDTNLELSLILTLTHVLTSAPPGTSTLCHHIRPAMPLGPILKPTLGFQTSSL